MAALSPIVAWLEAVGEGFGALAPIITGYGAYSVADLGTLDKEDITALCAGFAAADDLPMLPRKRRTAAVSVWLNREVANRAAADAAAAAADAADAARKRPPGTPRRCDDCEEEGSDEEYEDEGGEEEGEEEETPARAKGSTTRPRARNGKQQQNASAEAAAAGRSTIPGLFGRSSSAQNRHGLGGQASAAAAAAGNARVTGGLPARSKGQICVNPCGKLQGKCACAASEPAPCAGAQKCASMLAQLLEGALAAAKRTPSEIVMRGGTASVYNLARLKTYLLAHAFDPNGSPLVHLVCLQVARDCAEIASRLRRDCAEIAPRLRRDGTEIAPRLHRDCTPGVVQSELPIHHRPPRVGGQAREDEDADDRKEEGALDEADRRGRHPPRRRARRPRLARAASRPPRALALVQRGGPWGLHLSRRILSVQAPSARSRRTWRR